MKPSNLIEIYLLGFRVFYWEGRGRVEPLRQQERPQAAQSAVERYPIAAKIARAGIVEELLRTQARIVGKLNMPPSQQRLLLEQARLELQRRGWPTG